jgi:hypothetical protein
MSETTGEIRQVTDITGQQSLLTAEVIDLLGREEVMAVEEPFLYAQELIEISRRQNPFEISNGRSESYLTPEIMEMLEEVEELDGGFDEIDPPSDFIQKVRRYGGLLKPLTKRYADFVSKNYNDCASQLELIRAGLEDIDSHPELARQRLPEYYDRLMRAANNLMTDQVAHEMERVAEAELDCLDMDSVASIVTKDPQAKEHINELKDRAIQMKPTLGDARSKEYGSALSALGKRGEKLLRVRWAHRPGHLIYRDSSRASATVKILTRLRDETGAGLYLHIIETARDGAKEPSLETLGALDILHQRFSSLSADINELEQQVALDAEHYLITRAHQTHDFLRHAGVKLNQKGRRTLHELKDNDVERRFRRIASFALDESAENPYRNLQADPHFRQQCRDFRDILAGGGRIDYPGAKELAQSLHKLTFGNGRKIPLEAWESGFLVGIVSGRIDSVISILEKMEGEQTDDQLEKLRIELPDKFRAMTDFDIDATLANLKELFDDPYDNQALSSVLGPTSVTVRETIDRLWTVRQGEGVPVEPEEEDIDEYQSEPEQEQEQEMSNEELAIINAEIVDIAEQLEWVVFPPGANINVIRHILGENRVDLSKVNWERINHLLYLADEYEGTVYRSAEPKLGTSVPYLVATMHIHGRKFAVAECPEKGNATYVIDESNAAGTWEEIMRLPRRDARGLGAKAVIHSTEDNHLPRIIKRINSLLTVRTS